MTMDGYDNECDTDNDTKGLRYVPYQPLKWPIMFYAPRIYALWVVLNEQNAAIYQLLLLM